MRTWHGMIFGPDLCRFNPTSSNEKTGRPEPESVSGVRSRQSTPVQLSESASLYTVILWFVFRDTALERFEAFFYLRDESQLLVGNHTNDHRDMQSLADILDSPSPS